MLGDAHGPVSRVLLKTMGNASKRAKKWQDRCGDILEASDLYRTSGVIPAAPLPTQLLDIEDDGKRKELLDWVEDVKKKLRFVVAPKQKVSHDVQKLLALHAANADNFLVLCASHLKAPHFTAEFASCYIGDDLKVRINYDEDGLPIFETEDELAYRMAAKSTEPWRIQEYNYVPVQDGDDLCVFEVSSIVDVDLAKLEADEDARRTRSTAMRLLKRSLEAAKPRPPNFKKARKGVAKKPKGEEDSADDADEADEASTAEAEEDMLLDGMMKAWAEAAKASDIAEKKAGKLDEVLPYPGLRWINTDYLQEVATGKIIGRLKVMPSSDLYLACRGRGHTSKCVVWVST